MESLADSLKPLPGFAWKPQRATLGGMSGSPFFPTKLIIFVVMVMAWLALLTSSGQAQSAALPSRTHHFWLSVDLPVWDIADEGLPFRLTAALPTSNDWLNRTLRTSESRWTASVGYAKVYNSYDGATGVFKNPGGHAALVSAGRQFRWHLPEVLGAATPELWVEFGVHAATRRFPADGTRANFKLITGLEWTFFEKQDRAWSAALIWPHFSNANLLSRNAGYDGLALRIGKRFRF